MTYAYGRIIVAALAVMVGIWGAGCSSLDGEPDIVPLEDLEEKPKETPQEAGEKILTALIEGIEDESFSDFTKYFTIELKERMPRANFTPIVERLKRSFGDFESKEFLGELKWGELNVLLWKTRFSVPANDILITLQIGYVDGQYKLFMFSFQGQANALPAPPEDAAE